MINSNTYTVETISFTDISKEDSLFYEKSKIIAKIEDRNETEYEIIINDFGWLYENVNKLFDKNIQNVQQERIKYELLSKYFYAIIDSEEDQILCFDKTTSSPIISEIRTRKPKIKRSI